MKKLSLLLMLGTVLNPWSANATDCVATPDCASLGYTMDASKCSGAALKCPWDTSKAACKEKEALKSQLPILYGDGTVSKNIVSGKTPIGIVYDEANKLAVALSDINKDGRVTSRTMTWGEGYLGKVGGLCTFTAEKDCETLNESGNYCAPDSQKNTQSILSTTQIITDGYGTKYTCKNYPYAAIGSQNYTPSGCSKEFCSKTKWFVPSMQELQKIYSQKDTINSVLNSLRSGNKLQSGVYCSSNTSSSYKIWTLDFTQGIQNKVLQNSTCYLRPVINYGAPKPAQNIKFAINISNSCPSGLSFSGSYQGSTMGTFSCSGASCYDQGRYDGQGSNDSETVVKEGTSITLSNLNSNFTSIKSMVTGKIVPVSGGMAYFALNNSDEILAALGPGAYDFWMLQCSPVAIAKASVTAEVIVTGSSSNMFVDLNGTSVTCTVTATEDGRSAPVAINGGKTTNSFAAGQVTLACPRTIKPSTGSYTQYRISESEVDNGGRQTLNGLSVRVNATPNGSHTLKIYYQAI